MARWSALAGEVHAALKETFGADDPIRYMPAAGAPFDIVGVFDAAHQVEELHDGATVSTTRPVLGVQLADFPAPPAQDDTVRIAGADYMVVDVQPDGQGWALLILVEA